MTDSSEEARLQFARKAIAAEIAHRREKVWKIFSWSGTLLVAIIGGTVALKVDPPPSFDFSWWLRGVLQAAVIFLAGYGHLWINQNLTILDRAQIALNEYDRKLDIKPVVPQSSPRFGYAYAIWMLAAAAVVAIIIPV